MESSSSKLIKLSEKPYSLNALYKDGIIKTVQDMETKTLLMAIADVLHRYSGSQWPEFRNTSSTGQSIRLITGRFLVQVQGVPFAAKMQKSNRHHGQAVKTPPFHGGITSSNLVGVICRWTPCNRLKSIPTKISTGITGDSGFLVSTR